MMPERSAPLAKKVLLIGWDAADWKVAAPLMDEGKMPNLERFVSRGVMGNMATLYPVLSPMLWTSIATGKRAHKHGIHGFAEPDPRTGMVRPITNLGRKCKAVWNILQHYGLKSNVIGWWPSIPAEPISGVMVSNHFQEANARFGHPWPVRPGTVHPAELAPQLSKFRVHPAELAPEQVEPFIPKVRDLDRAKNQRINSFIKVLAETATVHAVATAIMQHEPWDFMAVYYDSIDHFCHGFMRYHPPRLEWVPEEEYEIYKDVINGAYMFHDMMLGALLALAGDHTTVILLSDHGFHSDHNRPRDLPNEPAGPADEHRAFGIFAMNGPGIKHDELIHGAGLLDITPTVLTLFGLPVGQDMDGRPLLKAFEHPPEVNSIPSWEEIEGECGRHPEDKQFDAVDAAESLKQLVALGYIEKPDEDKQKAVRNTVRELQYNLARSYTGASMLPEAIELFSQLWDEFPDEGRFGVRLFECQLQMGETAKAEATLKRLTTEKERYAREAVEELKKKQEELKDKKPEDLKPNEKRQLHSLRRKASYNSTALAYFHGSLLHAQGKYEEALEKLKEAERVQVRNRPSLYLKMGDCYIGLKRWNDARLKYREILRIDPINAEAHTGLARACLGARANQRALKHAMAALGLAYHQPSAHYLCGRALRRLKRYDEAISAFRTAIAQNPVFPGAHRHLSVVYRQTGQQELAERHHQLYLESTHKLEAYRRGEGLDSTSEPNADDHLLGAPLSLGDRAGACDRRPIGNETVVIVSGLPRSGTSMMMQMLAAGGVPVLTDGVRDADADNPRGYLEYEPAKRVGQDNTWLDGCRGKAVKLVAQLVPKLPPGFDYRIIFMERVLGEVVKSQAAMLERQNAERAKISDRRLAAAYRSQIGDVKRSLDRLGDRVSVLCVDYHHALSAPGEIAAKVSEFLGGNLDVAAMVAAVDPSMRRQRVDAQPAHAS